MDFVGGTWGETEVVRVAVVTISLTVCFVVSGCSTHGGAQTSRDCQAQVRIDGIVYTSYGHTQRKASRHSVADRADCDDVGEDAAGSVFPEDPQQVPTWSFAAYPPSEVVGVRFDKDSLAVFIADSVPDPERERIIQSLEQTPSP
jgi:hypothetical protein